MRQLRRAQCRTTPDLAQFAAIFRGDLQPSLADWMRSRYTGGGGSWRRHLTANPVLEAGEEGECQRKV
jgi:hypothetical protein